ncbi:hypothetical protein [Streptomyces sp. NPDC056527]|uniref:hypothetical protein n=1 Tax=Streptomyces sp. NPDC056527 TaxID=3345853 RepID=UPI0036A345EA
MAAFRQRLAETEGFGLNGDSPQQLLRFLAEILPPVPAVPNGTLDRRTDLRRYTDPAGHSFVLTVAPPAQDTSPLPRS